jgi:hypothetical protein
MAHVARADSGSKHSGAEVGCTLLHQQYSALFMVGLCSCHKSLRQARADLALAGRLLGEP